MKNNRFPPDADFNDIYLYIEEDAILDALDDEGFDSAVSEFGIEAVEAVQDWYRS